MFPCCTLICSGKTFTMTGITEYTLADIYDYVQKHPNRDFHLKFSAMEIYNESVRDLLSTDGYPLRLLDDPEEQSRSDAQKLIADVTSLVSSHMSRQIEMVDARLAGIRETAAGNKTVLDGHVSSIEGITMDAKRKWQEFSLQAENDAKDSADFSAAKHCQFELLLQKW
ncbi:putative minus-end-directed kinesin ATPase [Helianthus debilis subsp. tardiflorus]